MFPLRLSLLTFHFFRSSMQGIVMAAFLIVRPTGASLLAV
jgi:hypothetical protein